MNGSPSCITASLQPALNALTATVRATAAAPGRHGPLGLDPKDSRQLAHAAGTGNFPVAFEVDWLFALDIDNRDAIPKTTAIADLALANGFNQIVMNVFAYDVTWPRDPKTDPRYDYARPKRFPFGGDNTKPDHATLDVTFFQHLDRVIEHLDRRGLIAHLMIYVWNKQVAWPAARSADDNRYFDYVVKRYQAFSNIIWDISKEATGYGHNDMGYITDRIGRLRALDAHGHLVTVHDYGYCAKFLDQVDFISIQNWAYEIWHVMMEARAKHPTKPILNIEHGGYERGPYQVFPEGAYQNPNVWLDRAYRCVFAGSFPTHYWQDTSWTVVIHDPTVLPVAERPQLDLYRHLATLVDRLDARSLVPMRGRSNSGFCLSNEKDKFVFLVPAENTAIWLRKVPGVGPLKQATWFDPYSEKYSPARAAGEPADGGYIPPQPGKLSVLILETEAKP